MQIILKVGMIRFVNKILFRNRETIRLTILTQRFLRTQQFSLAIFLGRTFRSQLRAKHTIRQIAFLIVRFEDPFQFKFDNMRVQ